MLSFKEICSSQFLRNRKNWNKKKTSSVILCSLGTVPSTQRQKSICSCAGFLPHPPPPLTPWGWNPDPPCMPSRCSTTEGHPQQKFTFFIDSFLPFHRLKSNYCLCLQSYVPFTCLFLGWLKVPKYRSISVL